MTKHRAWPHGQARCLVAVQPVQPVQPVLPGDGATASVSRLMWAVGSMRLYRTGHGRRHLSDSKDL